jgi:N-acetylglucosamine-6-sulfatase
MALSVDLAPTLLELAGVNWFQKLPGRSLVPALRDPRRPLRDAILTEYFLEKVGPRVPDWRAVRTERWKYIRYPDHPDFDELYDLASDPREILNRAADAAYAEPLREMRNTLSRQLAETSAPSAQPR